MEILTMPVGDYQTNCYMVWQAGREDCILIDPGFWPEKILETVRGQGKTVAAILLTHGHFDHVGGVGHIAAQTGCKVWLHERDYSQFKTPENLYFYPLANCKTPEIHFCEEGEKITAGGLTLTVLETPGHTWGSVCYLCEDTLFSGDTLFAGACGRTDFPGSSPGDMVRSLKKLYDLSGDWRVLPGHGEETALSYERAHNPYMKGAL